MYYIYIYINSINCKFNIESDYGKKNREKWLILHVICDNIKWGLRSFVLFPVNK